jgi:hypothetical protein
MYISILVTAPQVCENFLGVGVEYYRLSSCFAGNEFALDEYFNVL